MVFRRQPDRTPTLYYDVEQTESEDGDNEEDDDYFSVEPVDIDEEGEEDQTNCEMNPDVTGAASSTKETPPEGLDETPKESGPGDASSIHSRNTNKISQKEKTPEREEEVMNSEDSDNNQSIMCAVMSKRANYVCFKPLTYYNKYLDRYYYYRYFKPYAFDHRLLTMGHDCGCPKRRLRKISCYWYDTDNIYMSETRADLSISENSAQQKIYKIYMEILNNLPDECGCGTLASMSYMGHSTSCSEFKHIHERESHGVLLAILNKKKKLSFGDETDFNPTRTNFDVQADADANIADTTQVATIPCAKEITS